MNKFVIITLFFLSTSVFSQSSTDLKLWYDKPAQDWMTEALPIGNGYIGAMFFGDPNEEHIQFSEGTLWSGGPGSNANYNYGIKNTNAAQHLSEVRSLLKEGKKKEADQFVKKHFTGSIKTGKNFNADFGDYGAQQTMGDLYVKPEHSDRVHDYHRELNISKSMAEVKYKVGKVNYKRTFFANYPSRVLVYRFESSEKTNYLIKFDSPHIKKSEGLEADTYFFEGEVADNGMGFETRLLIKISKGRIDYVDGLIKISDTDDLQIIHVAGTDYRLSFPEYSGNDYVTKNKNILEQAAQKTYQSLRKEHLNDYKKLFNRVMLQIDGQDNTHIPTDRRLNKYYTDFQDRGMESLYFQYARYLMISGSRPGTMSMHLQGKWNNSTNPPWACDYHSNINLEMIYWPAEITNLSECHEPFLAYIESLVEPGKLSAKAYFGTEGWMVNTMCNAFGYTSPGWGIPWGFFPAGAGWFAQHFYEHFDFTQNKDFLRNRAYPLMKEAAKFWLDYLTLDENGFYVSAPSYSPEHGGISSGASMDHQIAWDLLNNCVLASETLNIDQEFSIKAKMTRDKILAPQIGKWGQLQEWKEDVDNPENKHRHVSHLFALHPGKQISVDRSPQLAEAAKTSLMARGDSGTGWSLAWKMNFWARLQDGTKSQKMLHELLKPVQSTEIEMSTGGGSYSNLLCAHPPFQLDGNMGGASGIAEMLLQSHQGFIHILPALPDAWKSGEVKGLKARGGFEVSIKWSDSNVEQILIKGQPFQEGSIRIKSTISDFKLDKNGFKKL